MKIQVFYAHFSTNSVKNTDGARTSRPQAGKIAVIVLLLLLVLILDFSCLESSTSKITSTSTILTVPSLA